MLLEESLVCAREVGDPWLIAWALQYEGLTLIEGDWDEIDIRPVVERYAEGLARAREVGDPWLVAWALQILGWAAQIQGDGRHAAALFEESLALRRLHGDKLGMAYSLTGLADVAWSQGDYGSARAYTEERHALDRELGNRHGIADSLFSLGHLAWVEADDIRARALLEESLALSQEIKNALQSAWALCGLGHVANAQSELVQAAADFTASLKLFKEFRRHRHRGGIMAWEVGWVGAARGIIWSIAGLAAARRGIGSCLEHPKPAVLWAIRLMGAVDGLLEGIGSSWNPARRSNADQEMTRKQTGQHNATLATAWISRRAMPLDEKLVPMTVGTSWDPARRADYDHVPRVTNGSSGFDDRAFAAAWAEGRAMTVEQAIAYALEPDS
jgi:tetratricopeptide (TPR) repeat protein